MIPDCSWRLLPRLGLALVLGGLLAFSQPPYGWWPILWLALPGLLWLLDGCGARNGFAVGLAFGFGFFLSGLYWVGAAFLVHAERYAALLPLAVLVLPAVLALFPATACGLLARLPVTGWRRAVVFAVLWTGAELLRGHWPFGGFPWLLVGYGWSGSLAVLQVTSVIGIYGLGLLTVLLATLPLALRDLLWRWQWGVIAGLVLGLPLAVWGWGQARLSQPLVTTGPLVRLVQGAVPQAEKWQEEKRPAHLERFLALSRAPARAPLVAIVWPETAISAFLVQDVAMRLRVTRALPDGAVLYAGTLYRERAEDEDRYFNSLVALDRAAMLRGVYHKHTLVPFGEYVPLRHWLPIPAIAGTVDFSRGPGPQRLAVADHPVFSPLICYEGIFPGRVVPPGPRPAALLNVTNDAWFGNTVGPHQHLAIVRVRAIEEGLPLLRAANTGISAAFDGAGRLLGQIALGQQGALDVALPPPLSPPLFARLGNWLVWAMMGLLVFIVFYRQRWH